MSISCCACISYPHKVMLSTVFSQKEAELFERQYLFKNKWFIHSNKSTKYMGQKVNVSFPHTILSKSQITARQSKHPSLSIYPIHHISHMASYKPKSWKDKSLFELKISFELPLKVILSSKPCWLSNKDNNKPCPYIECNERTSRLLSPHK